MADLRHNEPYSNKIIPRLQAIFKRKSNLERDINFLTLNMLQNKISIEKGCITGTW